MATGSLYRFGVSLEKELIDRFDEAITQRKYANRSEAIRDLIRDSLVQRQWAENDEVAGAITLLYDHHAHGLSARLMHIEHDFTNVIVSSQHIHLDHDNCLEIVAVKGRARRVRKLSCTLKAIKGIKHVTLNTTATGRTLK
ncbi:MAG: nickel-responsive transcriptional regulator NikR [Chitinivibrionales bacterium]|nr:nickel-responsive transcriptional regulator NikR [Chitinivibrionales bacterium]MBD3395556.1 nickel-responsive transcriptional regulator NikR [Chitinivibrionales bacterium]